MGTAANPSILPDQQVAPADGFDLDLQTKSKRDKRVKPSARTRHRASATIPPARPRKEAEGLSASVRSYGSLKATVPSDTVGRAMPRLPAFLAIQSRATRMLSSVPALSW